MQVPSELATRRGTKGKLWSYFEKRGGKGDQPKKKTIVFLVSTSFENMKDIFFVLLQPYIYQFCLIPGFLWCISYKDKIIIIIFYSLGCVMHLNLLCCVWIEEGNLWGGKGMNLWGLERMWRYVRLFGLRDDRVDLWGWFIISLQICACY